MNIQAARHYLRLRATEQQRRTQEEGDTEPANIPDSIAIEIILDELTRLHHAVSAQEEELRRLRATAQTQTEPKKDGPAKPQGARHEPSTTRSTTGKRK